MPRMVSGQGASQAGLGTGFRCRLEGVKGRRRVGELMQSLHSVE